LKKRRKKEIIRNIDQKKKGKERKGKEVKHTNDYRDNIKTFFI